jgi:hypothetical protein
VATYHGKSGRLYASPNGTGVAIAVASLTDWSIDLKTDRVETTAFGDANKTYVQGLQDLSGTFSGFFNDADTTLASARAASDGTKLYLYPSINIAQSAGKYLYGPAWVDVSITTGTGDAVKIAGTFAANGSWYLGI